MRNDKFEIVISVASGKEDWAYGRIYTPKDMRREEKSTCIGRSKRHYRVISD
jgi:hypothetical protein